MKKRIISILLLWLCAFILVFPLKYWSYEAAQEAPSLVNILQIGSAVLNYAIIVIGGIVIGKRLQKDISTSIKRSQIFERLIFILIIWLFYYFSYVHFPILIFIESLGATNITSVDYLHMSAARIFIYELLFAPSGFFALILSYATIALTLSKKSTVPVK